MKVVAIAAIFAAGFGAGFGAGLRTTAQAGVHPRVQTTGAMTPSTHDALS